MSFSSLLLGIRERFFGYTRTVFWAYAKGFLGVRKRLLAPSFAPARTALKPCPDVAHTLSGRCFQSGKTLVSVKKDDTFSQEGRCSHLVRAVVSVRKDVSGFGI